MKLPRRQSYSASGRGRCRAAGCVADIARAQGYPSRLGNHDHRAPMAAAGVADTISVDRGMAERMREYCSASRSIVEAVTGAAPAVDR